MNAVRTLQRRMRTAGKLFGQFVSTCKSQGIAGGARFAGVKVRALVRERAAGDRTPGAVISAKFDEANGVDTTGLISMSALSVDSPNFLYATVYKASDPDRFAEAMSALPIRHEDYAFVDLGSGKGLALLLASHFPFRKVVGVEFARELHQVAESNIRKYRVPARKCEDVSSVCGDAAEFEFPACPLVIYFYHPFEEALMQRVAQRINAVYESNPRPIVVTYFQPVLRRLWAELPCLTPVLDAPSLPRGEHMVAGYSVFATPEALQSGGWRKDSVASSES